MRRSGWSTRPACHRRRPAGEISVGIDGEVGSYRADGASKARAQRGAIRSVEEGASHTARLVQQRALGHGTLETCGFHGDRAIVRGFDGDLLRAETARAFDLRAEPVARLVG